MTREEAIRILKSKMDGHTDTSYEWAETVRMAIQALEQEPCEDYISRQEVLEPYKLLDDSDTICIWLLRKNIEQLSPVTPKSKTDILDKIRAEIEQITDTMGVSYNQYVSKIDVLQIIDKYRGD